MNVVAIIQARMSSTRLPGKVLMDLAGQSVLWHVIHRLQFSNLISKIVIATSSHVSDDDIENWCAEHKQECYRGSLNDLLDRYFCAATFYKANAIVRITADCPLIDPMIVDEVIEGFMSGSFDLYGLAGEFPDGLDCSVFSFNAIKLAWERADLTSEREHVGPYIEKNHDLFKIGRLYKYKDLGHHRWTLDEEKDYQFLSLIFESLYKKKHMFYTSDVLSFLKKNPDLMKINNKIIRNEGYLKSLELDSKNV